MSSTASTSLQSDQVVCTLYEGHYHYGLAGLVNSLVRGGFTGLIWVGYRGPLPPWIHQLQKLGELLYALPGGGKISFEALGTGVHFTNYKPDFLLHLIERNISTKYLWYFDPDITVRCSWRFMTDWIRQGITLCEEITNGTMPANHPLRLMWVEAARESGWSEPLAERNRYYNGGFIGFHVEQKAIASLWKSGLVFADSSGSSLNCFMKGQREDTFYIADQDALNLALMYTTAPLSTIGPEGMGFVPGGFTMYHSVGSPKPWRKSFLRYALRAIPPTNNDKHFLAMMEGPIRPYSPMTLRWKKLTCSIASLIGRFYARR
jgi:hypothetical protein